MESVLPDYVTMCFRSNVSHQMADACLPSMCHVLLSCDQNRMICHASAIRPISDIVIYVIVELANHDWFYVFIATDFTGKKNSLVRC